MDSILIVHTLLERKFMEPIKFTESNIIFAEDQQEYYQPLPAYRGEDGEVISCWSLTLKERLTLFLTGRIWLRILTYNKPLQPSLLTVENPFNLKT